MTAVLSVGDAATAPYTETAKRPPLEAMGDERFTAISSGYDHACALRESSEPICWAWRGSGSEQLLPYGEMLASISSGGAHVCGLRQDGTAVCWGDDWAGQSTPPGGETVPPTQQRLCLCLRAA